MRTRIRKCASCVHKRIRSRAYTRTCTRARAHVYAEAYTTRICVYSRKHIHTLTRSYVHARAFRWKAGTVSTRMSLAHNSRHTALAAQG
jgi:hypothetical protein